MNYGDIELTDTVELRTLCQYAAVKKAKLQDLLEGCINMNFLSRVRDSKVPEKHKISYHFSIFKASDKCAILERIRDYHKFCDEISAIVIQIIEPKYINSLDLRRKIDLLQQKLTQVYESAKLEVDETSSKTIYHVHQSFIKEYKKLYLIVKYFEILAYQDLLMAAKKNLRRANDELIACRDGYDNLKSKCDALESESKKNAEVEDGKFNDIEENFESFLDLQAKFRKITNNKIRAMIKPWKDKIVKYRHRCDTYDAVKTENQKLVERQNSLSAQNEQFEENVDEIRMNDNCNDICYTFDAVESESHKIAEKQMPLTAQNGQLDKNKDKISMSDKHYDICDTYDALKSENQEFAEKQDALTVQNGQLDQTMDTEINNKYTDISQKYESLKIRQGILLAKNERLDEKVDDIMRLLRSFNP